MKGCEGLQDAECRSSWQLGIAWHSLAIVCQEFQSSTKIEALVQEIKKMESADSTNKAGDTGDTGDVFDLNMFEPAFQVSKFPSPCQQDF